MNSFTPKPEHNGYRGYIASRRVRGDRIPQAVQGLVVRDYAQRMKLGLRLPAVEYAMPGCYMMLESVMEELPQIEGVIFYSLFMLPERASRREAIYQKVFDAVKAYQAEIDLPADGIARPALLARTGGKIVVIESQFTLYLYLDGKKKEATAAVPDALVDEIALIGPKERIRDRLDAWKASGVGTMIVGAQQPEALRVMAELCL